MLGTSFFTAEKASLKRGIDEFVKYSLNCNIFHLKLIFYITFFHLFLNLTNIFLNNFYRAYCFCIIDLIKYKILHVSNLS